MGICDWESRGGSCPPRTAPVRVKPSVSVFPPQDALGGAPERFVRLGVSNVLATEVNHEARGVDDDKRGRPRCPRTVRRFVVAVRAAYGADVSLCVVQHVAQAPTVFGIVEEARKHAYQL